LNFFIILLREFNAPKENTSFFAVSLDAWTSSNGYAFMAIVLHWIGNNGKLGK
jgi:hypothetical protein